MHVKNTRILFISLGCQPISLWKRCTSNVVKRESDAHSFTSFTSLFASHCTVAVNTLCPIRCVILFPLSFYCPVITCFSFFWEGLCVGWVFYFGFVSFSNITAEHQPAVARTHSPWVPVILTGNILTQLPGGAVCSHLKGHRKSEGFFLSLSPSLTLSLSLNFLRVLKITCWGKSPDGKEFKAAPRCDITALRQLLKWCFTS